MTLFQTCHHNRIFAKINAKISVLTGYSKEVWVYQNGNIGDIQKYISLFRWENNFENLSINEKVDEVDYFNATLLNIFRTYIPSEIIKSRIQNLNKDKSNKIFL